MADDGLLNLRTVMVVPGEFIQNFAYDANNQLQYEGYAPQGTAISENHWVIRKYTYSSGLQQTTRIAKNVAWTDRASVTYT